MTAKDIYAKTYPLGGIHGNSRPLEAFEYGRDLTDVEIKVLRKLFSIYSICSKITASGLVLIGHSEFNSVEYSLNISNVTSYIEFNGIE